MSKLDASTTGFAAAITLAVLYSICALAFALFPDGTLAFLNAWFHGMDLNLLKPAAGAIWTVGDFLYGLLGVSATGFVAGSVFTTVSNFFRKS